VFPEPRIQVVPDQVRSAGRQIAGIASMAGIELDEAQRLVADAIGGVGADGKWSAFECVIFAPRQNLKTEVLIARLLFGLFVSREDYMVYSSHAVKTSTKTFKRVKRAIDRNPRLGARIARVSNRIGAEQIELTTGQTLECVARSTNSGRGFTGSTIIVDEAHAVDSDQLAASLPMLSTAGNPQVIYGVSFADEQSWHVAGLRERALDGKLGVCWLEWSMADDDEVEDREVWKRCNPAYHAGRITMGYMEKEFQALGPDRFARERLGRSEWPVGAPDEWLIVGKDAWEACYAGGVSLGEPPVPVPAAAAASVPGWQEWPGGIPPWVRLVGLSLQAWDDRSYWFPMRR
jgi:hypothetical protein